MRDSEFILALGRVFGRSRTLSSVGDLFPYAYDAALEKRLPGAVVFPETAEEVASAVRVAREFNVPFAARGAGTNLCGGTVVPTAGLVIHLSRMNRILSVDVERRRAWVEPGVVNLHLQKALAPRGLLYAPDPASQKACTLGGNVGTNAGGPHCLKHGVTSHHVTALEFVRPDGGMARVSVDEPGFDLTGFFVGTEGTLGVVTKIEVNLLPQPEDVQTFLVAFPSMEAAAQTVTDTIASGIVPTTLEVMDGLTVRAVEAFVHAGYPAGAEAVLLIEVDGPPERTRAEGERIQALCAKNGGTDFRRAADEREREKLWEGRRGAYPAMARLAPNVLVEDGVVPRTRLPEAVRRVRAIADREGLRMGLIAHAGDGNLHPNIIFDERDRLETSRVKAAGLEMLHACVELGGSISGEHGIGSDKREAMRWLFPVPTLDLFRRIKTSFDPDNLCNPDKLIPAADAPPLPRFAGPIAAGPLRPASVEELQEMLRSLAAERRPVFVEGLGTKGLPVPAGATVLETAGLARVVDDDPANLTLTVQAGAALADVQTALAREGHFLAVAGGGTLGGIFSANAMRRPPLRNQVLGLKAVLANGDLVVFGGKVMKNVAGYDAAKLFIGAWGALGVIVEVTLRVYAVSPEGLEPAQPSVPDFAALPAVDLHRRMKEIFDPRNLINPSLFSHGSR